MSRAALVILLLLAGPVVAQPNPESKSQAEGPVLDRPDAFERAYAVSTYSFDACGDALAGRMFRRALAEKFAHCPFTSEARSRYREQTQAQLAKTRRAMARMIEDRGGLPMQLDGMPLTCHEQQASEGYKRFRGLLDQYSQGNLPAEAVVTAPCDAPDLVP